MSVIRDVSISTDFMQGFNILFLINGKVHAECPNCWNVKALDEHGCCESCGQFLAGLKSNGRADHNFEVAIEALTQESKTSVSSLQEARFALRYSAESFLIGDGACKYEERAKECSDLYARIIHKSKRQTWNTIKNSAKALEEKQQERFLPRQAELLYAEEE